MGDKVFIVADWTDSIQERPRKDFSDFGNGTFIHTRSRLAASGFDTEREAAGFIVDRAGQGVAKSEKNLKKARLRLKKCAKKFAGVLGG